MVRHHQPRKGSVAFSPRKRVAKETPRIKAWPSNEEPKLLGLAGYKAGMTHAMVVDCNCFGSTTPCNYGDKIIRKNCSWT